MTKERINAVLAEACNCTIDEDYTVWMMDGDVHGLGMFTEDLNAVHLAESRLLKPCDSDQMRNWRSNLYVAMRSSDEMLIGTAHANAEQRAKALVVTIGRWED